VPLHAAGVTQMPRSSVEPDYELSDIKLDAAEIAAPAADSQDGAVALLGTRADLLAAAEIVGAARQAITMTRDHITSRTQFGQPLGVYQALKHRLADAYARTEAAAAAVNYAAAAADAGEADAAVFIAAAKLFAGKSGKFVAETAMQLHGAIGYTFEYPLHLVMRRLHRLGSSFSPPAALEQTLFDNFKTNADCVG